MPFPRGRPRGSPGMLKCSGEINSPCAKDLPLAKPCTRCARPIRGMGPHRRPLFYRPGGWDKQSAELFNGKRIGHAVPTGQAPWEPWDVKMLGRNQFALRQGFAFGKTLYALRAPHPRDGAPIAGPYFTDQAVGMNSLLNCSMAKGSVMPAM